MSLKCYDGFDHYGNSSDFQSRIGSLQWFIPSGHDSSVQPDPTGGRNGTGGVQMSARYSGGASVVMGLNGYTSNTDPTFIMGVAINLSDWQDDFNVTFIDAQNANAEQIHFVISTGPSQIKVYRGATLLGSSPLNIFSTSGWNYFEFHALISDTVGTVHVDVNGQPVIILAGVDTKQSINSWVSGVTFTGTTSNTTTVNAYLDDFYVCDSTASPGLYPCNTFLGNVRVDTVFAVGNDSVTWTPLSMTNWQEISDTVFAGDSSYNFTNTPGNIDLFNFGALDGTVTGVIAVQTTGAYRLAGAGSHTIVQEISSSGTVASGSTWALTSSYQYFSDIFLSDPHTGGNWLTTGVNALNAGYDLTS